jgi:hypothetical protein
MNYSAVGNGKRERLKIMRIGQSAALIPYRRHYEGVGVQRLSRKGVAPSGAKSGAQKDDGQSAVFFVKI